MTTNETVSKAAAVLFEGEVVAVVRGRPITETPAGFAAEGFVFETVREAVSSARLSADLEAMAPDEPVIVGESDCVIRLIDTVTI